MKCVGGHFDFYNIEKVKLSFISLRYLYDYIMKNLNIKYLSLILVKEIVSGAYSSHFNRDSPPPTQR